MGILGLIIIYPFGNVAAIDAYFFGASASTESGLNTVDVMALETYQQLYLYFIPIFTNLGFINMVVVAVRLYWFETRLKETASSAWKSRAQNRSRDVERGEDSTGKMDDQPSHQQDISGSSLATTQQSSIVNPQDIVHNTHIAFADDSRSHSDSKVLYVPGPRERDQGQPIEERDIVSDDDESTIKRILSASGSSHITRRRPYQLDVPSLSTAKSIEQVASSFFALGGVSENSAIPHRPLKRLPTSDLPGLSKGVTVGRNSRFYNLTTEDRDRLGGIEYHSLKLLLKIVFGYFFGLHIFGAICLVPWIHRAPAKYTDYLQECGQDKTWWAFYSAQTMVDNLGFTLTPDSMVHFNDATWPLLVMSFLAFAGNTLYPVILRLVIWTMRNIVPKDSVNKETLQFILDHPRRCYTLLFPARPTWILFGIIFTLNFVDVVLIIVLDLHNPAVNNLSLGPRILSAIFQAASSRHTGTSTFNLAEVNPAVQFSLVVMMYISILPIAISIRSSNAYEEKALGIYPHEKGLDESSGSSYVMTHIRNQLSFDLWYIFLGTFCICIAEANQIMDNNDPAFSVFSVFFEVVSGYCNVGLSLGYPTVNTSLSGQFTTFSKVVMCLMMIRGRHRGLPYALDRAIMLPSDHITENDGSFDAAKSQIRRTLPMRTYLTT
ncbi:Potassium transport protein, high-affinity [Penicillium occitanis (nom. inval.)]|nr:Potassium transport protein, high-affinity [Penicillium occitanis (nom. inval.)]PCG89952.1 hypothetical protein PENOC_104310 [Penicillium occitanis (nom. inval.)]